MRNIGVLLCSSVLVAALSGCGGGEPSSTSGSGTPSPAPSASGSTAPTPSAPSSGTTDDGLTTPGSRLAVGDPAAVFLKRFGEEPSGLADLSVTEVEEVPAEEVEAAGGPGDEATVWLLRASLEITEVGEDFGPLQLGTDLTGIVQGRAVPKLDVDPTAALDCPPGDLSSTAEVGETVDFCVSAVAEPGQVVEAAWSPFETDYSLDGGTPIVWSPGR